MKWMEKYKLPVFGFLFTLFFLYSYQVKQCELTIAVCIAYILILCFGEDTKAFLKVVSVPAIVVSLYLIWQLIAGLYGRIRLSGAEETATALSALCIYLFALRYLARDTKERTTHLIKVVCGCLSVFAIFSLDGATLTGLCRLFLTGLLNKIGATFHLWEIGYESGTRAIGVFENANILAGLLAVGIFLSLTLELKATSKKEKAFAAFSLSCNGLVFFLNFSMGALIAFFVSALIWLMLLPSEQKKRGFFAAVINAVLIFIGSLIAIPGLGAELSAKGVLGYVALIVTVCLTYGYTGYVSAWLDKMLEQGQEGRKKKFPIVFFVLAGIAILYIVLGVTLTGAASLTEGEELTRKKALAPGQYEMTVETAGAVSVQINSQNEADVMTENLQVLYEGVVLEDTVSEGMASEDTITGNTQQITFKVPEYSVMTSLTFSGDGEVKQVSYSGAENGNIKLNYLLLPEFAVNRLQGLTANQNATQRIVMWQDGIRLWLKAPIIGNGLGSFEWREGSVQNFYYESRYVHNQYIQSLVDTGLIGFLLFIAGIVCIGYALLKQYKQQKEERVMLTGIITALCMMLLHGGLEVIFSIPVNLALFFLLAAVSMAGGTSIGKSVTFKKVADKSMAAVVVKQVKPVYGVIWIVGSAVIIAIFTVLLGLHVSAYTEYNKVVNEESTFGYEAMITNAGKDVYTGDMEKLYALCSRGNSGTLTQQDMEYVDDLLSKDSHYYNMELAENVLLPYGMIEECGQALIAGAEDMRSSDTYWNEAFTLLKTNYAYYQNNEEMLAGYKQIVMLLYQEFEENNQDMLVQLVLSEDNEGFVKQITESR